MAKETASKQDESLANGVLNIEQFKHIREPYGTLHLVNCTWTPHVAYEGCSDYIQWQADHERGYLEGTVKSGVTTSRLLHFTSHKDETGKPHYINSVSKDELEKGYQRTIAM